MFCYSAGSNEVDCVRSAIVPINYVFENVVNAVASVVDTFSVSILIGREIQVHKRLQRVMNAVARLIDHVRTVWAGCWLY